MALQLEKLEGCNCNKMATQNDTTPVTKEELFKTLITIDREFLKNKGMSGLGDMGAVSDTLKEVLNQKLTDADFTKMQAEFVQADIDSLSGLDGMGRVFKSGGKVATFFNKVTAPIANSKVVQKVQAVVAPAIKRAVSVVQKVIKLPTKGALKAIFSLFEGRLASKLSYALIPDNSPVLVNNPKVAEKRKDQLALVKTLSEKGGIDQSYFLKHIENGLQKGFNKDANQFIKDASKSEGLEGDGMGEPLSAGAITAIIGGATALFTTIGTIISIHKNKPGKNDFTTPIEDDVIPNPGGGGGGGTNPGGGDNSQKGSFSDIFFSPMGFIVKLPIVMWATSQLDFSNTETVVVSSLLGGGMVISGIFSFLKK